ncbi:MAG: GNAT family N-acetyltransferase [Gammaproteobacteria bacterium]|nr:GNAT family N-acetyltransferase [Gammaproteobacteria bacterium]
MLEEQLLDPQRHDRNDFSCGIAALDIYLQRYAAQQQRTGISTTYVLVDSDQPATILGYYTLSAAEAEREQLATEQQGKLPHHPIPCFRMGRLACRQNQQGKGLGRLLLGLVVSRCLMARTHVAAWALIVDAKDQHAADFYRHYGFKDFADKKLCLYLPLGTPAR